MIHKLSTSFNHIYTTLHNLESNMTIRKKLILSNILMILIPILIGIISASAILEGEGQKYWYGLESMLEDNSGMYSAQSIILAYQDNLSSHEWKSHKNSKRTRNNNEITDTKITKDLQNMEQELASLGYHFSLIINGEALFNNITDEELILMQELISDSFYIAESLTMTTKEIAMIKSSFTQNQYKYEVTALHMLSNSTENKHVSYLAEYIIKYIVIFILIVLISVALMNFILSWWISRSILIPLKKLKTGSHKIKDGELDFHVDYEKGDEFGEVCKDFDDMRGHLKKSVEERLMYEKYRTKLLSGISHDLRTPLTSIIGYAEGLQDGIANTPEKQKRYYEAIHTRANDMETLVDNLSMYTHLENGNEQYFYESADLNQYLQKILLEYQLDAAKNNTVIKEEYSKYSLPVKLDIQKIPRVFLNILTNSIKYRKKNTSLIIIKTYKQDDYAAVSITDDGEGVPEEDLSQIFECFYRGDAARTKPGEGNGLGLSIVKQIIEGHGGNIRAENNDGLSIIILLPLISISEKNDKGESIL